MFNYKQWSLKKRMLIPLIISVLGMAFILSLYFIMTIVMNDENHLQNMAKRTVNTLAHGLEYSVASNNIDDGQRIIDWLITQDDIYKIVVKSGSKTLLKATHKEHIGPEYLKTYSGEITLKKEDDTLSSDSDLSIDVFTKTSPTYKSINLGTVEVTVSSLKATRVQREDLIGALIFVTLVLVSAIVSALYGVNAFTSSFNTIIEQIKEMGTGNLGTRINIDDEQELGTLADTFNGMAIKVQEKSVELKKANELKSHFMATMSHDLRSPLGVISSMLEITLENKSLSAMQRMHLTSGMQAAKQLERLINDILDFGKIEDNKEPLHKDLLNLNELITNSVEVLSPLARSKNIQILSDFRGDDFSDKLINGDEGKLLKISNNLISNAIKFTEIGSVIIITTWTKISKHQCELKLSVSDTGIGIPKEKLNDIFMPFQQLDASTSLKYGGSGLGLSIANEYVDLMNGKINVDSQEGFGSKFTVTIPFEYELTKKEIKQMPEINISSMPSNTSILLVDDASDYHEIVNSYLGKDIAIDHAKDGLDALKLFNTGSYKLILLDCMMPNMNGFEFTEKVRAIESEQELEPVIIIAMTANNTTISKKICLEKGMNDFLLKPFNRHSLTTILNQWNQSNIRSINTQK